jgi:hypothetical protein
MFSCFLCAAILNSTGESNRLAISDPDTDTLHLSPRDIINAMTALHGTMTGAEVDALHLPLKKKLAALADLPAHIVTFRGNLARLNTAGQAPLALDAYRLFLASLSPFTVLPQYTLLFTVQNGAIGQQKFEAYAAYLLGQHSNILAQSTLWPFADNIEGYEDGASEDDGMGETHCTQLSPHHHTPNTPLPTTLLPSPPNLTLVLYLDGLGLGLGMESVALPLTLTLTLTLTPYPLPLTPYPYP